MAGLARDAILLYPTLSKNQDGFGPIVTGLRTDERVVWLTFDDGPHPRSTPQLLELLEESGVQATHFVVGRRAEQATGLVEQMAAAGHEIANHTYSHWSGFFWCLPPGLMRQEIERAQHVLRCQLGYAPRRFRAPVGMVNPFVHPVLARNHLQLVGWSATGHDGCGRAPLDSFAALRRQIRPGAIVLLHDGRGRAGLTLTAHVLRFLREEGYRCVIPESAA